MCSHPFHSNLISVLKPGEAAKTVEKKSAVAQWLEKIGIADKEGKSDYRFSFGNLFRYASTYLVCTLSQMQRPVS